MTQATASRLSPLGGSAGGIEAFSRFFEALEERDEPPGMAFIVILHLAPDRHSDLPALLHAKTGLPVEAAWVTL